MSERRSPQPPPAASVGDSTGSRLTWLWWLGGDEAGEGEVTGECGSDLWCCGWLPLLLFWAMACFRRVQELMPGNKPAQHNIDLCEKAIAARKSEEQFRLGLLLFRNREHNLAISVLEDLLRGEPGNSDARQIIVWARREREKAAGEEGLHDLIAGTLEGLMNETTGVHPENEEATQAQPPEPDSSKPGSAAT